MKEKKILNFLKQAEVIAENSPDAETKVGSIFVDPNNYTQLSSGFNGPVRKAPDSIPNTRPAKYSFFIHSEVNAVCNAARNGHRLEGSVLFCTLSPCMNCLRTVWNSGVSTIYFKDKYRDFDANVSMPDLRFSLTEFEGYYKLELRGVDE
jgi:dCMP deaminase